MIDETAEWVCQELKKAIDDVRRMPGYDEKSTQKFWKDFQMYGESYPWGTEHFDQFHVVLLIEEAEHQLRLLRCPATAKSKPSLLTPGSWIAIPEGQWISFS